MGFALGGERGRFFAGLPLRLTPSLPWSVHGQLDPEPSRNSLKHSDWNDWARDSGSAGGRAPTGGIVEHDVRGEGRAHRFGRRALRASMPDDIAEDRDRDERGYHRDRQATIGTAHSL